MKKTISLIIVFYFLSYSNLISPAPASFVRIVDDQEISINGRRWRTIIGSGHSPEHACLYSAEIDTLISGDQVLPKITPNISVWPQEPKANPLALFLSTLEKLQNLGEDTLVLPSNSTPLLINLNPTPVLLPKNVENRVFNLM